jgi:unsaturated rhamnogalacturonyl hydrolase
MRSTAQDGKVGMRGAILLVLGGVLGCSGSSSHVAGGTGGANGTGAAGDTGGASGTGSGGSSSAGIGGAAAGTGGATGSGGAPGAGGSVVVVDAGARDAADAGAADARTTTLSPTSLAVRFADAVMTRWPDPATMAGGNLWEYNHGIVLRGIEQVYRHTSDARYLTYIQRYADEFVSAAGVVNIPAAHSFDNIQPSVLLPFLFQRTGLAKYHTAADQIRARYDTIPRNPDRGFWHKSTYPNQMWLDSIYMGEPFLMRYGATFGTCGTFCSDTVVEQMQLIAAHVRDATTGLLYHAWDDSPAGMVKAAWADPTTGRSPSIWGRALGWYAMALVDILPDVPADHAGRSELIAIFASLAAGLKATQDPATGLWFQVVDKGAMTDNWIETSGSAMFVYALKVGVNLGYIDASYLAVANRGWDGLKTKVTNDASGLPTINGAVQGLGVQNNYAGYINQLPTLSNSSHGLCAILLAAAEMEAQ